MKKPILFLSLLVLLACDSSPRRLVRLGSLMEVGSGELVALPKGKASPVLPYRVRPRMMAGLVARLRLRARGDARLATLTWKLDSDRDFPAFRTLSFPLVPDGQEHTYEIDLQREPYWTGKVEALRLAVDRGTLEVLALEGDPPSDPYRSMSLGGVTRPSLAGLSRMDIPLPNDLPRGSILEAHLGLVPEYDRPGVQAIFRAWREKDGRRTLWLERAVAGTGEGQTWHPIRKLLPSGGGWISLEVEATRRGNPLPDGAALWGNPVVVTPGRPQGKNLIVVLIDTLRADLLGAYGGRPGLTPRLDGLARDGIRFEEMLAPAPWTLPSVSSLMTGLQPQTHGAGMRNGEFAPTGLTGGARTMAEVLHDGGFYTFGVYHNIYVNPAFGLQQGFDEYASMEERAEVLVDQALDGLRRIAPDRRFFLYLHLFDPHNPYEPPAGDCARVSRAFLPGYHGRLGCFADRRPEYPIPPPEDRRWHEALYRGEVAYTDRQLGRFLDGLRSLGLDDDTVVAVVSDHGEEFWTRLEAERAMGYEPNADHGHTLYQELLHVPAVLRVPGRGPAVVRGPVQLADLFPTLLRLVGIEPPPNQGTDLAPRLDGSAPTVRPTLLAGMLLHGDQRWSIRRGPWKLVVPEAPSRPLELYDLSRDPRETRNQAASQPGLVATLRALGEQELAQRRKTRTRYIAGDDALGATFLEWNHITKLRALGYLK